MNGSYVNNLESGKLELHFSKADYLALPQTDKDAIKSACLFSGRCGCWVSRSTNSHWRAEDIANRLGLTDGGSEGERLTFAEQQAAKVERAEDRAQRMAEHAENANHRSAVAFERADLSEEKSGIPLGQPILVGHHSEGRHRRAIERADNAMRHACEESDKAKYFEGRAEAAERTASQGELQSRRYLQNRIDENEAKIRDVDRRLARSQEWTATPEEAEAYRKQLAGVRIKYQERLDYYKAAMAALGGVQFGRENVHAGDLVKVRGRWEQVVKANGKTVAVTSCFPWPLKYTWAEVQEHKPVENAKPAEVQIA